MIFADRRFRELFERACRQRQIYEELDEQIRDGAFAEKPMEGTGFNNPLDLAAYYGNLDLVQFMASRRKAGNQ